MTERLLATALHYWQDIDGHAAAHGLPDLGDMSLGRLGNFVWWWLTRNADHEDYDRIRRNLWRPPPGQVGQGPWSADEETQMMKAAKAALQGK